MPEIDEEYPESCARKLQKMSFEAMHKRIHLSAICEFVNREFVYNI